MRESFYLSFTYRTGSYTVYCLLSTSYWRKSRSKAPQHGTTPPTLPAQPPNPIHAAHPARASTVSADFQPIATKRLISNPPLPSALF